MKDGRRVASLVLALVAAGCGPAPRGPGPSGTAAAASPAATTTDVPIRIRTVKVKGSDYIYLTEQKKDRIVYKLRATSNTSIRLSQGNGISDFETPHVIFYGSGGTSIVADAPHARVAEREKTVVMSGGVHSQTNEGMILTSDTLRYDDSSEILHGEGNVKISTKQGEHFSGQRMDYNLRTTELRLYGDAK